MKGRSLILIFLFICIYSSVASAATEYNDTVIFSGQSDTIETGSFDVGTTSVIWYTGISFENPENTVANGVEWYTCTVPYDHVAGIDGEVTPTRWDPVTYKVGGVTVGTGEFGYMYNTDTNKYYIGAFFDDNFDISGYTGFTHVDIIGGMQYRFYPTGFPTTRTVGVNNVELDANAAMCGYNSGGYGLGHVSGSTHSVYTAYSQQFDYVYGESDYSTYYLNFSHTSGHNASLLVDNGRIVYNDTSSLSTHDLIFDTDLDNTSWDFTVENTLGDSYNTILTMAVAGPQSADVLFNQSIFTNPDPVGVIYDIDNFDNTNYEYWILVTGTNGGTKYIVSNEFYDITTAIGQDNFTISYSPLSLPFIMRAELWMYSKLSGESSILATSLEIPYNPISQAPGQIWTDKTEYNVSELVKIHYTSSAALVYIDVEQTDGDGHFYFDDLNTGIVRTFFFEHQVGTWRIRLRENGIYTNSTSVDVLPGPTPYVRWAYKNQLDLGYGAVIYVFADDSDATLAVFDGAGTETYNATVGDGYHTIQTKLYDYFAPGVWTASLLNTGTRYNDTTVVGSSAPIVRFDSTVYETGDTIGINYFIPSNEYKLILTDSNYKEIIKFTTSHGVIGSGSFETVSFSLVDGNEYGMNIQVDIDNGKYKTGPWYVFVENPNGTIDKTIYDSARVKTAISEPSDASNEMIKILFSVEGLFLILTVCLTMMGLVAAQHPAGGGAGAVVGVGFGVYFGALPVWMLLLMVIALVVLAGVSVAVYFKGKT